MNKIRLLFDEKLKEAFAKELAKESSHSVKWFLENKTLEELQKEFNQKLKKEKQK